MLSRRRPLVAAVVMMLVLAMLPLPVHAQQTSSASGSPTASTSSGSDVKTLDPGPGETPLSYTLQDAIRDASKIPGWHATGLVSILDANTLCYNGPTTVGGQLVVLTGGAGIVRENVYRALNGSTTDPTYVNDGHLNDNDVLDHIQLHNAPDTVYRLPVPFGATHFLDSDRENAWRDQLNQQHKDQPDLWLPHIPDRCWRYSTNVSEVYPVYQTVAQVPVLPKISVQADTGGWEPGKPVTLYVRVDHKAPAESCPVDIILKIPDWMGVEDSEGATFQDGSGVYHDNSSPVAQPGGPTSDGKGLSLPTNVLTWHVTLRPGQPFERWVTLLPGGAPPETRATQVLAHIGPVGINANASNIGTGTGDDAILTLPVRNTTVALQADRQPLDGGGAVVSFASNVDGQNINYDHPRLFAKVAGNDAPVPLAVMSQNGQPTNELLTEVTHTVLLLPAGQSAPPDSMPAIDGIYFKVPLPEGATDLLVADEVSGDHGIGRTPYLTCPYPGMTRPRSPWTITSTGTARWRRRNCPKRIRPRMRWAMQAALSIIPTGPCQSTSP